MPCWKAIGVVRFWGGAMCIGGGMGAAGLFELNSPPIPGRRVGLGHWQPFWIQIRYNPSLLCFEVFRLCKTRRNGRCGRSI